MDGYDKETCCSCRLCIPTNMGCECGITDKKVKPRQKACIDYIPEDD